MQLDKTTLDRLLSLDDATLAKTITALASSAGIDKRIIESAVKNLRLVRASLSNATEADLKKAADLLGHERTETVMRQIEDTQNGNK